MNSANDCENYTLTLNFLFQVPLHRVHVGCPVPDPDRRHRRHPRQDHWNSQGERKYASLRELCVRYCVSAIWFKECKKDFVSFLSFWGCWSNVPWVFMKKHPAWETTVRESNVSFFSIDHAWLIFVTAKCLDIESRKERREQWLVNQICLFFHKNESTEEPMSQHMMPRRAISVLMLYVVRKWQFIFEWCATKIFDWRCAWLEGGVARHYGWSILWFASFNFGIKGSIN